MYLSFVLGCIFNEKYSTLRYMKRDRHYYYVTVHNETETEKTKTKMMKKKIMKLWLGLMFVVCSQVRPLLFV